jgi:formyl-CoA transferase
MSYGPLMDIRVVDAGVLFAAPLCGTLLGDFGADVIKVEHPNGDPLRSFGWLEDGESIWWKVVGRNKRSVELDLSSPRAQEAFVALAKKSDVVLESFRPGTLERWNLSYDRLSEDNPGLILLRTSGFGQTGPYRGRPGFGTIAEAMSGFAAITGPAEGPPTLPPIALADGVAALTGTMMVLMALHHRTMTGIGQVIDLSLIEPLFWLLGPQATIYDRLGIVQRRTGNRTPFSAPRNLYQAADGKWVAISCSNQTTAVRIMSLVGGQKLATDPRFATNESRVKHADALDEFIRVWIQARASADALADLAAAEVPAGPVYDITSILSDPHFETRDLLLRHEGLLMQGLIAKLSVTPGAVRLRAPEKGEHTEEVLRGLDLPREMIEELAHPKVGRPTA